MVSLDQGNTIKPIYLAIHLTYKCPAKCDHCCFSSGPGVNGRIDLETAERAIDQAAQISTLTMVGFTGGEPMLYPRELVKLLRKSKNHGLRTRIVTSAAWAKKAEKAEEMLADLKEAGLDEISLSYDDSHAPFITERQIANCVRAAASNKIPVAINVCVDIDAKITGATVKELLEAEGIDTTTIRLQDTLINSTGRAEKLTSDQLATRGVWSARAITFCAVRQSIPTATFCHAVALFRFIMACRSAMRKRPRSPRR